MSRLGDHGYPRTPSGQVGEQRKPYRKPDSPAQGTSAFLSGISVF